MAKDPEGIEDLKARLKELEAERRAAIQFSVAVQKDVDRLDSDANRLRDELKTKMDKESCKLTADNKADKKENEAEHKWMWIIVKGTLIMISLGVIGLVMAKILKLY